MHFPTALLLTLGLTTSTLALPSLASKKDVLFSAPWIPRPLTNEIEKRQLVTSATNSTEKPKATIRVCTKPEFKGECHDSTWPVNTCIDLRGYKGITESFGVMNGFECLVMQGACNASTGYVSVGDSGKEAEIGEDLTEFSWIKNATSYMCFTEIEEMRRFIVRSKAARVALPI